MAKEFNTHVEDIERKITNLIVQGKIKANVDTYNHVWKIIHKKVVVG